MLRIALVCSLLAVAGCSNGTSQPPAPPQANVQTAPGTVANPIVPGNNSSIPSDSQATRTKQTGEYGGSK